ncbi:tetratricopeptide repeat protein [Wenzhouxiangella sp. XN79A]|uniref:tetratricopeptide repeat protein n=1 Tax=Wenzhouxiangella sp. XN79A TaxID=2724193 RepID=UPI00144A526E|nr:tetratricopeptide repeat protein [Wenzhouxiangella sp. XN79A]NKI36569.1 tetratricopeptide repeat protein [Wenzhouxiangella sp. XN79A]
MNGLLSRLSMLGLVLALAGCAKTPLIEGNDAFVSGDFEAAEATWLPLAANGDVDAQHNLGVLHHHLGDTVAAARWWRSAAEQQFVPSMRSLARLELANGDRTAAVALFHRAARWGDVESVSALEVLGEPVPGADLWRGRMEQLRQQQRLAALRLDHRMSSLDSNDWWEPWNRLDEREGAAD